MTRQDWLNALVHNVNSILPATGELTDTQRNDALNQVVANCNTDTVNPDKATHPVVRG